MLHRPNFCCSCGEKIDRIEWHLWTSSRYCEVCQSEHQLDEWLPRIFAFFILFTGLFGIGASLTSPSSQADLVHSPVRLAVERAERMAGASAPPGPPVLRKAETVSVPGSGKTLPDPVRETPEAEKQPVYICGAATKKGTACTRRVKGGGRCWQHKGKDAMVPEEELLVPSGN